MATKHLVRTSRDGDRFHYLWAARRCLELLSSKSKLVAVVIEGASPSEDAPAPAVEAGEELIDVAEYESSEDFAKASLVRYVQLKHSTLHADSPWTPSGLANTLNGFAQRFANLRTRHGSDRVKAMLRFSFVSNRPIDATLIQTVDEIAHGRPPSFPPMAAKLENILGLAGTDVAEFCALLKLQGSEDGLWEQRNILTQELSGYLPDADVDAPTQLIELVNKKALSESASNPAITKIDVLRALHTDEASLFPAPCLVEVLAAVPREQEVQLVEQIVGARGAPVIIHAAGGVGKSILATRIGEHLPEGSENIVYDCFGNGQYRSASGYRHRHRDALVEIANELAAKQLCHPLIPSVGADGTAYLRVFIHRLKQAVAVLKASHSDALLCIAVDAADNAQMAAEEAGQPRSFIRDLLREVMPEGVRLVALCRTHRQDMLDPPPDALRLELQPFSPTETEAHLRRFFPDATEHDVAEFHRLSSQNPRVQALALSRREDLGEILRRLGPNPTTVDDAIGDLLNGAIAQLRDKAGATGKVQIDSICEGMAALRPLVPISVLAAMSGVPAPAIKSFALDLGRPLLVAGETVQFFDEPAETWFREKFKPKATGMNSFVAKLRPLAMTSGYVASVLPQLMLEAGLLDELVLLALSSQGLPSVNPLEKRDIELQRLQFALKASLRARRYGEAAKLALKAGGESAGDERQRKLIQSNTDIAATFMDPNRIQDTVSRRQFTSSWLGSHHVYEAGLLAGHPELLADARSRLRISHEWLANWSRLPTAERDQERVSDADIAELALAHLNIHGAKRCAAELARWSPRQVSFRAGQIVARRLVDHARFKDIDDLAHAADRNTCLLLAIIVELGRVHRVPPKSTVERTFRWVTDRRIKLSDGAEWRSEEAILQAITCLVEAAHRLSLRGSSELAALLSRYLPAAPPRGLMSPHLGYRLPLLRAYALRAALEGKSLESVDLAHPDLRRELEDPSRPHESQEAREFRETTGALLPWHRLWAAVFLGRTTESTLAPSIAAALATADKSASMSFREETHTADEMASVWLDLLLEAGAADANRLDEFKRWATSQKRPLYTTTLTQLVRLSARAGAVPLALHFADEALRLTKAERIDAEEKAEAYVALARALVVASRSEAMECFREAVEVTSKIGDENIVRWDAILDLSRRAADPVNPQPEITYRLSRCAELIYDHVSRDKHFDWEGTVSAIAALCPSSSLAILSRWRDRKFGDAARLLPVAVGALLDQPALDTRHLLAFVGFRATWDYPLLMRVGLGNCGNSGEKKVLSRHLLRYAELDTRSSATWVGLKSALAEHNLSADVDLPLDYAKRRETVTTRSRNSLGALGADQRRSGKDWDRIFSGLDLATVQGPSTAFRRFRDLDPPYISEDFFAEACRRVSPGHEAEFIAAVASAPDLELYQFFSFLIQVPQQWRVRLSVKASLARALTGVARRRCLTITKGRHYSVLTLKAACEACFVSEADISEGILSAISEVPDHLDASRLFTLIGFLVDLLKGPEALDALSFGLGLLEPALNEADGDGVWCKDLSPPIDMAGAIAGYIWAGLAAPSAALRWEAAHVVRALCTLRSNGVMSRLIDFAQAASASAFVDARLPFYSRHARQWLLIALARAAKENADLLVPYLDFLTNLALDGEPHVLQRQLASEAALTILHSLGSTTDAVLRGRLEKVNRSALPPASPKERGGRVRAKRKSRADGGMYFGIDMEPYWFAPLGRCFGLTEEDIAIEAEHVLKLDWQHPGTGRWDEDERLRRRILRDDAHHSHGSYPRADSYSFYLSYHAMMVVAGKLLARLPVVQDADEADAFSRWLSQHLLSRSDGNWLSDRRDPTPSGWLDRNDEDDENWRWSLRRGDFDKHLFVEGDVLNVRGHWSTIFAGKKETVHVDSALVSDDRALALLRALQTANNSHDYRIPDAGDELEIDAGAFKLRGWIAYPERRTGIDSFDPWAGNISYPAIRPAQFVVGEMSLSSDAEERRWARLDTPVLWAQIWGQSGEDDSDAENDSGSRLQASFSFVVDMLRKLQMDLVLKVEVQRSRVYSKYERRNDDGFEYLWPNARLFLLRTSGEVITI